MGPIRKKTKIKGGGLKFDEGDGGFSNPTK